MRSLSDTYGRRAFFIKSFQKKCLQCLREAKAADKACTFASPNILPEKIRLQAAKIAAAPYPFKSQSRIPVHLSDSSPALPAPCRILPARREGIAAVPHFLAFAIAPRTPRANPSVPFFWETPSAQMPPRRNNPALSTARRACRKLPAPVYFPDGTRACAKRKRSPAPRRRFSYPPPFSNTRIQLSPQAVPFPPGCAQADKKRAGRMSGPKIIRLSASC